MFQLSEAKKRLHALKNQYHDLALFDAIKWLKIDCKEGPITYDQVVCTEVSHNSANKHPPVDSVVDRYTDQPNPLKRVVIQNTKEQSIQITDIDKNPKQSSSEGLSTCGPLSGEEIS